jgi:prolyl oligopeptidase
MALSYPPTRRVEVTDHYHGTVIHDPYRWLEDATSAERTRWVASQNALTAEYLSGLGVRSELRHRFEELLGYQRRYELVSRGPYLVFKQSEGLSAQPSIYAQRGVEGLPQLLVSATDVGPETAVCLGSFALSRDAAFLAYGFAFTGGDCEEYRIKEVKTGRALPDRILGVAAPIAWQGHGFYYCRYPPCKGVASTATDRRENQQVWYHRMGTAQEEDRLAYEDPAHPLRLYFPFATEDERWVVLSIIDPTSESLGNALAVLDSTALEPTFVVLVTGFDDQLQPVAGLQQGLVLLTNRAAPNYRIILVDPTKPSEQDWRTIVPEREHPIERVRSTAERLFVVYREGISPRLRVFDHRGKPDGTIGLPGIGLVSLFEGQARDTEAFWCFADFTTPPTIYRYNVHTRESAVFHAPRLPCDLTTFETRHVLYASKDGTQVPVHLVHWKGLRRNGNHPLLLYGYGGSATVVEPAFDPLLIALLERGVVFAAAGLRGGGEYGEPWHQAGCRKRKQNVFDDCIAAAEWLQASGYTSLSRCGLIGASNGGLLVGAVMTQRPDLFKVALPCAGILDMLRYQRFTIGWSFVDEYGSSDDPRMFPVLLAYSPLHNIKTGLGYPATLVSTSEHDDRVVSAHSLKFIATLQREGAGPNPYLVRVTQGRGHGSVTLPEALDERADLYAFFLAQVSASDPEPD